MAAIRVGSTEGCCLMKLRAALNRASSSALFLITSLANFPASSGCLAILPSPNISTASAVYPSSASIRALLRRYSFCPHHSCTTRMPGRFPFISVFSARYPLSKVPPARYSTSCPTTLPQAVEERKRQSARPSAGKVCILITLSFPDNPGKHLLAQRRKDRKEIKPKNGSYSHKGTKNTKKRPLQNLIGFANCHSRNDFDRESRL